MTSKRKFRYLKDTTAGYAVVVIYRYPSKTEPLIVNTYYHADKKEAESHKQQVIRDAKRDGVDMSRLVVRARPLFTFEEE